jgi:DegV family protein with EDD domain
VKVKIVTDSTADIPQNLIEEFGITIVPLYLLFGEETYRDKVDMNEDEFYQKLLSDPLHPTTTQPTPEDFTNIYEKLATETDSIVSIHISSKLSGTCNSATQGAKSIDKGCTIEVIDSKMVSMALGLIVLEAANMAKSGKNQQQIIEKVKEIIDDTHILVLFDTLKYLAKGGRIGKAKALFGSMLNVKPILTIKDGEFLPVAQVRSRTKGIEKLVEYTKNASDIQDITVVQSTTPDEAQALAERLIPLVPQETIKISRLGPVLGVHGGPGVLAVAYWGKGLT